MEQRTIEIAGRTVTVFVQREYNGEIWATASRENSDNGYTLTASGSVFRQKYRNGELVSSVHVGTWK
jgi:hypothetical protein